MLLNGVVIWLLFPGSDVESPNTNMAETEFLGALGSGPSPGSAKTRITRLVVRQKRRKNKVKIEYEDWVVAEVAMPGNMARTPEIIQVGF